MSEALWTNIDTYIEERLIPQDDALLAAITASRAAGLPPIAVSAAHGRFLQLIARVVGARRILEVGTLGGYSAIWLARGLVPGGSLVTLEIDPDHAEVARSNIARAGLAASVTVRTGPALESLPALAAAGGGPFDLAFIDADKANNPNYVEWAVRLGRTGTLIVVDNVVREGAILDPSSRDDAVRGTRRTYELVGSHPRLVATAIQTVGTKGHDGFLMALVTDSGVRR
ncbi:MAG: O-methyltransferase [Proteobacteria bacterium]|nr:O-methyltransferase [Pseudomonadota bacterium]